MALGTITVQRTAGRSPNAPTFHDRVSVPGDDSYPTGGTVGFSALVSAASGISPRNLTVQDAWGYGKTAGALTHFAEYDGSSDTLKVYLLAGAEVGNGVDLSSVTFDLSVLAR